MIKVAVVGLGYWGPNLVRVLNQIPEVQVAMLCDESPQARDLPTPYPVTRTWDYRKVLDNDDIDAVVLVTPISTHYEMAYAALSAGKHVFVEKPMATSSSRAQELIGRANQVRKLLMPGHTFMYSPAVQWIQEAIRDYSLGDIKFISMSRLNGSVHTTEADVLWDLGPHDFSILMSWLHAMPDEINCIGDQNTAFINMKFGGILAHVQLSWMSPVRTRSTIITGTEGMIVYDDTKERPITYYEKDGSTFCPALDTTEPLLAEMRDFIDAITYQNYLSPLSNATLGLNVVKTIEMAQAAKDERAGKDRLAIS